MKDIATIQFQDTAENDKAVIIVRSDGASIGLAVSLQNNGDLEVLMGQKSASELIEALRAALT